MKFNFYTFFGFFFAEVALRQGVEQREALPKAMEAKAGTAEDPVGL